MPWCRRSWPGFPPPPSRWNMKSWWRSRGQNAASGDAADSGSGELRKRHVSAEFVAVLARLLTNHGNRVGAMLYGAGVDTVIPTRSGRRHVLHLLHRMLDHADSAESGPTRLQDLLSSAA